MSCSSIYNCPICGGTNGEFRCKTLVITTGVENDGDVIKFMVDGMGTHVYETKWQLPDLCPYGNQLPIDADATVSVFLSESFMNNASPPISWSLNNQKHPGSLDSADYEPVRLHVDKATLGFRFADRSVETYAVELEKGVQLSMPLAFGQVGNLVLPANAVSELARQHPAVDFPTKLGGKIRVLDVQLMVRLHGRAGSASPMNLFDSRLVAWTPGSATIRSGAEVKLHLHSDFHAQLDARPTAAPPANGSMNSPPRASP